MRKWLSTLAGGLLWEKAMPFCTFQWNVIITVCPSSPPPPPLPLGICQAQEHTGVSSGSPKNWSPRIDTEPIQNTSNQISFSHSTFTVVPPLQVNWGWGLALIKIPPEQKASQICLMHNIQILWSPLGWCDSQELPGMNKRNLFPIPFCSFLSLTPGQSNLC